MTHPHTHSQPRVWCRYVAIGDSFTEGMCDPDPVRENQFVGWADRLAGRLAEAARQEHLPFGYANLAVRGRTLEDVVGPQLDRALDMEPDLVSMVGGGNDILRPTVDLDSIAHRLEDAVARIRATGADVLLATPTDTREAGLFKALRGRHGIHTANLFSIAQRHECYVLDLWGMAALRDWRMWAQDRIHLTSEGHRRVAEAALIALGQPAVEGWDVPLAAAPPQARSRQLIEHLEWARHHAGPWVRRRIRGVSSGDLLAAKRPELASLTGPEPAPDEEGMPDRYRDHVEGTHGFLSD